MRAIKPGEVLEDHEGNEIGRVTDVVSNPTSLQPEWVTVRVGRFGGEHLVPLEAVAERDNGALVASFAKERVKSAPRVKDHAAPGRPEREALFQHYGVSSA